MAAKKKSRQGSKASVEKSDDFRSIYTNVQSWATTEDELILTLLRAEPKVTGGATGTRFNMSKEPYVQEAIVYMSLRQAELMCAGILASITKAKSKANGGSLGEN